MSVQQNGREAQLRQPRLAEIVADAMRQRILSGSLQDGGTLPNQETLLAEFRVSKPSLREALRILETEGLITVQRGNVGGAVVHLPQAQHAAYTLGLVLQSKHVTIDDVGRALKHLEAECAGLCAAREDRATTVVPELRALNQQAKDVIDDELAFVRSMADFHEAMVNGCGNQTMLLVAGAIESLWLAHVRSWAQRVSDSGDFPDPKYRANGLKAHERLTGLIERGDVSGAVRFARDHVDPEQFYEAPEDPDQLVTASALRQALPL